MTQNDNLCEEIKDEHCHTPLKAGKKPGPIGDWRNLLIIPMMLEVWFSVSKTCAFNRPLRKHEQIEIIKRQFKG